MQSIPTEWLLLASPFLVALLLIKLFSKGKAKQSVYEAEHKNNSKNLRVEPSAALPETKKQTTAKQAIRYQHKPYMLTNAEKIFYRTLHKSLSSKFLILMKVRVADVLEPEKGINKSTWQSAFNRIKAKHFDFVLCSLNNYQIIAAIELDDSSHQQEFRMKRDKFLNQACESADFPLIRFHVKERYDTREIIETVVSNIREYRLQNAA